MEEREGARDESREERWEEGREGGRVKGHHTTVEPPAHNLARPPKLYSTQPSLGIGGGGVMNVKSQRHGIVEKMLNWVLSLVLMLGVTLAKCLGFSELGCLYVYLKQHTESS